jgi:outer membrane lipoprotein SlyB
MRVLNIVNKGQNMEPNKTSNRIHPLVATAAVSVTLASLIGVAAITGLLPNSHSSNAPEATLTAPSSSVASNTTRAPESAANPFAAQNASTASTRQAEVVPETSQRTQTRTTHSQRSQPRAVYDEPAVVAQAPSVCSSCGRVESVNTIQHQAKPSGVGIAAGAVLGGVLGNQVGNGNGRTLATVAGAVGGGYAGNEVEKRTRSTTSYQVRVRMDDGSIRTFPYSQQPGWTAGERVKVVNGALTARG